MDGCVLEFVLLFVIEDEAVLFDEADDGRLPSWTLQECNQAVENPVLQAPQAQIIRHSLKVCMHFALLETTYMFAFDGLADLGLLFHVCVNVGF